MNVETMIYAYLMICTSMIVFNCACVFAFRRYNRKLEQHSARLERQIVRQLKRLEAGQPLDEGHRRFLRKKLRETQGLMAFDRALEKLQTGRPAGMEDYLREVGTVFTCLALENRYRNVMDITFFAYVIRKYRVLQRQPSPAVLRMMMELLHEPSLSSRENGLQTICSSGNCAHVLKALHIVDENRQFYHAKMLTDDLLTFGGDSERLADALWQEFEQYSVWMRVVILDYIRFSGKRMEHALLQLLGNSHQDDEIRFSCLRYFGKFRYEPAFPMLLVFVEHSGEQRWEYAALAASSLASYPCERSIQVLKGALSSANWYLRFNAARSLTSFHLSYLELSDVLDGGDRYAAEILRYWMDMENARSGQGVLPV